jgi:hypothetical protein
LERGKWVKAERQPNSFAHFVFAVQFLRIAQFEEDFLCNRKRALLQGLVALAALCPLRLCVKAQTDAD